MNKSKFYICPVTKKNLFCSGDSYITKKFNYKIIKKNKKHEITDFLNLKEKKSFYSQKIFYKNYLSWLSKTLLISENSMRKEIFQDLKIEKKISVLFVGCGFGDEIKYFLKKYGLFHNIYAQDLSKTMIMESSKNLNNYKIIFSISNANSLPYKKDFFDLVFHFGGINQFDKKKKTLTEINRVTKPEGKILISDEGMAPWLSKTERYKALKINNRLWSTLPPLSILPIDSGKVNVSWILKNNFYKILYKKNSFSNKINYDIVRKSPKGGSIRTRYEKYYKKNLK